MTALLFTSLVVICLSPAVEVDANIIVQAIKRESSSDGTCQSVKESELCLLVIGSWFFDVNDLSCRNSTGNVCGGKTNRFQSSEECQKTCSGYFDSQYSGRQYYGNPEWRWNPRAECPQEQCPLDCETERVTDSRGCPICRCKVRCINEVRCPEDCYPGLQVDSSGCRRCICNNHNGPEPPNHCPTHCPHVCPSQRYDWAGSCCNCFPGRISNPSCHQCPNHCPNGHVDNQWGCRSCACRPGHHGETRTGCPIHDPYRQCGFNCQYGYVKNTYGCDTCQCLYPASYRHSHYNYYGASKYYGGY